MSGSYCMARILVEALLGGGIPHSQPCTANQQPLPTCTFHHQQGQAKMQCKLQCNASCGAMQARMQCKATVMQANIQPTCIVESRMLHDSSLQPVSNDSNISASHRNFSHAKHNTTTALLEHVSLEVPEATFTQVSACLPAWNLCRSLPVTASTVQAVVSAPTL